MKYTYILLILLNCSCLDQIPENTLTYENAFTTENELNTTTSTIHFYLNVYFPQNQSIIAAGAKADETLEDQQIRQWNPKAVIASVESMNDWKGLYDIIYESNLLLENIHKTENLTEDRYNFHIGQAHFALGLSYFALAQRYGDCVITENASDVIEYGVSPMIEVIDKAIFHAKAAYDLLPLHEQLSGVNGAVITSKQYGSKGNSSALLAYIYAWKAGLIENYGEFYGIKEDADEAYRQAIQYAGAVIDKKVGYYELCPSVEKLCEYLSAPQKENPESILAFTFDRSRSEFAISPNYAALHYVGWPVNDLLLPGNFANETDYKLYRETALNMFPDPADERRNEFFYKLDEKHTLGGDYAVMYKFRNSVYETDEYAPSGKYWRTLDADYVYWRLADLILLRAECHAKLNETALAASDLNTVRKRAGATAYPSAYDEGMDLKKAIFKERERELLGENDSRYYDIIRNHYIQEELAGKFKELSPGEIKGGALFLPIPRSAYTDANGMVVNTKIHQKTYWLPYI